MDRSAARRGLFVYLTFVFVVSFGNEAWMIWAGGSIESHPLAVVGLMWTPAFAMVITRLVRREGFGDVSFAIRGPRVVPMLAMVWLYPIVVGLVGYGAAWISGLGTFQSPERAIFGLAHLPAIARFALSVAMNATLGTLLSAITATGEELGWRGYMVPRLVEAGVPRPLLASGLIWGAWHLPLIVSGQYAAGPYPVLSAAFFLFSIVAASYVVGRARLDSGSVWPAVLFHSAWNAIIQGSFDRYTAGGGASRTTSIWTGESGILVALTSVLVAVLLMLRPWDARMRPKGDPIASLSIRSA